MLLHKLYQFQCHGLIGLGTHIGNKFQRVIPEPLLLIQIHGVHYFIIRCIISGAENDSDAVLP